METNQSSTNQNRINKRIIGFGVVIAKDRKVLLGYQTRWYEKPCWAFPGGKVEEGETIEQAVIREVKEECGLEVSDLEFITFFEDIFQGTTHVISLVVKANSFKGEPKVLEPEKCQKWEWFEVDNIPENRSENLNRLINSKYWKDLFN